MKKVYLQFFLCILTLILHYGVVSQTYMQVGTGTSSNGYSDYPCPLQDYYEGSRAQYLYHASELWAAGMTPGFITSINFNATNVTGTGFIEHLTVKIGATSVSSLNNTSWLSGLQDEFGWHDYLPWPGLQNYMPFAHPFFWNGWDNIVLEICNGDPYSAIDTTYTINASVTWTTGLNFNASHTYAADNLGYLCGTPNTSNNGSQTTRPITYFLWSPDTSFNVLKISAFADLNSNALQDAGEPAFKNANFITAKPGRYSIGTIGSTGNANVTLDTGTYYTHAAPYQPYYTAVPSQHTTSNVTYHHVDSVVFAMQPTPGISDVGVSIIPVDVARAGFTGYYKIVYENKGTDTIANGSIKLIKSSKLNYVSASAAPVISGDTLQWNYSNLKPLQAASISVYLRVPPVPVVNIGDMLVSQISILPLAGDANVNDNTMGITEQVRASADPNDKSEAHGGKITTTQVNSGDYLTYTIRFQNTGNATASTVIIKDTLRDKLDWSSLEMLTASGNYQMTMDGDNCMWTFSNINLVDSNHNEAASHGYLVYRIKPKSTVQAGDVITNRAAIYFDYNLPVNTNTDTTTVVSDVLPLKLLSFTARKDGKTNRLQWSTANEMNVDRFEVERSANGREYSLMENGKLRMENGQHEYSYIDYSPLTIHSNYYRLKMIDRDGAFTYSRTIQLSTVNSQLSIAIHPNPVKDVLQVNVVCEKKATLQVQVVAQDGRVLLTQQWNVDEGNGVKTINTSTLQSGSYFLSITSADKEQSVVKFEKQ